MRDKQQSMRQNYFYTSWQYQEVNYVLNEKEVSSSEYITTEINLFISGLTFMIFVTGAVFKA